MAIKSVLAHLDSEARSAARLETAIALARDHGAKLTALYVIPQIDVPAVVRAYVGSDVLAAQERAARQSAAAAEADFRARTDGAGIAAEWRCEEGDVYDIATLHARYADIAVIGQTPPGGPEGRLFLQLPEQVVLASGRPVVVVPYVGSYPAAGRRVLVSWNGGREATRAVHDALPLLERAERVSILSVNPGDRRHLPGADIAAHLARHGVRAEAIETSSDEIAVGDAVLSRAADLSADLLVMGAYGHSRAREWAMGGVTRSLLNHMTLPVLMSH